MLVDSSLVFTDKYPIGDLTSGFTNIGDVIDLGENRDLGEGKQMYVCFQVNTTFVPDSSSSTIQFYIVLSDTKIPAVVNVQVACTEILLRDFLIAGSQYTVPIPPVTAVGGYYKYYRYIGIQVKLITGNFTAGNLSAFITYDPPSDYYAGKEFPD